MKARSAMLLLILVAWTVSVDVYAQREVLTAKKRPMTIGETICSTEKFITPQGYWECVKKKNEPLTLPDLRVHGISVRANRGDSSGFVTWGFTVQAENRGGTKGLPAGQMPVFTDISFGRVCPEYEYCPENFERLQEEHYIAIPRPGEFTTLSFEQRFYDPDGSGDIPKSFYVVIDARYGPSDFTPGLVVESNEYNNNGFIDFNYVENAPNYWYKVYP